MSKKIKPELTESQKKTRLIIKIAAAVVALIVAVLAISNGVYQLIHKSPGFYKVDTKLIEETLIYSKGIELNYWFEGKSSEIRNALLEIKNDYSDALSRIYMLLDAENTYNNLTNLAYVNQHIGEEIELPEELFDIIVSAYELTKQGVFNLFGGALYKEWEIITISEDQAEYDPLINPDEKERIEVIAAKCADLENFSLEVVDPGRHIIKVTFSDAYLRHMRGYEIRDCVLNLGFLKEAYEIEYTAKKLEEAGWHKGYFTTDSGMSFALSGMDEGAFFIYSLVDGAPRQACRIPMKANAAYCSYRSFGFDGELQYYMIGESFRHPHYCLYNGEVLDKALSATAVSFNGELVNACVKAYSIITSDDPASALSYPDSSMLLCFVAKSAPKTVAVNKEQADKLYFVDGEEFTQQPY